MSGKQQTQAQTRQDRKLDDALEQTFPASDPFLVQPVEGPVAAGAKPQSPAHRSRSA
jgi:hypothetical protein